MDQLLEQRLSDLRAGGGGGASVRVLVAALQICCAPSVNLGARTSKPVDQIGICDGAEGGSGGDGGRGGLPGTGGGAGEGGGGEGGGGQKCPQASQTHARHIGELESARHSAAQPRAPAAPSSSCAMPHAHAKVGAGSCPPRLPPWACHPLDGGTSAPLRAR